jgi:hypothetical protein
MTLQGFTVPAGFETDLTTGLFGHAPRAGALHDWLYTGVVGRAEADRVFRDAIISEGYPVWLAWTKWVAVRVLGWIRYEAKR